MTARNVKSVIDENVTRLHESVDDAKDAMEDGVEAVGEQLASLETQLREFGDLLKANAKTLGASASEQIKQHPLAAFGVAFVAGLAVAKLLRRR